MAGMCRGLGCAGALLVLLCGSLPARAQPPVEVVGEAEMVCAALPAAGDLRAACPALPPLLETAQGPLGAGSRPLGFDFLGLVPARSDERGVGHYVFGEMRGSHAGPYLAFAPEGSLAEPRAWEFFTGRGLSGSTNWVSYHRWQIHNEGEGAWSPGQRASLFRPDDVSRDCQGFQPQWNEGLRRWLMFYNCGGAGQVRVSAEAWGPWSDPAALAASGHQASALLIASEPLASAAGAPERKTAIYWLGQPGPAGPAAIYRSTLRQAGAD